MAKKATFVRMTLGAINAAVLFQNTQEFAEQNNYEGLSKEPPPSGFSPRAEAVGRILKAAARGGDSFGCKTSLVHRLVSAIMVDDPLPPLSEEDRDYAGPWSEEINTIGFAHKWLLFAVEDGDNFPGHNKGELVLKDIDSEMGDDGLRNLLSMDGTRSDASDWLEWEDVRPATYEECRRFAWQFADKGSPPKNFQPDPKPDKKAVAKKVPAKKSIKGKVTVIKRDAHGTRAL